MGPLLQSKIKYHAPLAVLFVCLGNICRSPLAEGIFNKLVLERKLSDQLVCDSAGTGAYHVGELADVRTRQTAQRHGICLTHRARQLTKEDFLRFDYVLVMDASNRADALAMAGANHQVAEGKIFLLRSFESAAAPHAPVPDPYYDGPEAFEEMYHLLEASVRSLLDFLTNKHSLV